MRVRADTSRTARTPASARTRDGHRRRGVAPWARAAVLAAVLAAAPAARAAGAGGDLLWPTDAGRCVTSSFCEFRSGHFHAGIDISTNGRTGYRVYAVDGGDVVRVRSGCKGYGKALYLRLRDGRTAVYAHLDAFAGAVEDTARAIGARTGSAYFDREFPPGTFPFARGDIVAYSGESGIGVPHLHFEIRDAQERPMDPLRAGLAVTDRTPPRVRRVAITPLDAGSSVDGGPEALRLDGPEADRVIPVEGRIGLAIDASDTKDGCRYDLAPSSLGLREGDRLLAEVSYDAFSFDETGRLDFQIDPRFSYPGRGRLDHLFRRPGYDLPFARDPDPDAGAISADGSGETLRSFDVFARDAAGHETTARLLLSFAAPPSLVRLSARFEGDSLAVEGAAEAGGRELAAVALDVSADGGRSWRTAPAPVLAADGSFAARLAAPDPAGPALVRARAADRRGIESLPRAVGLGTPPGGAVMPRGRVLTHGDAWELRLDDVVFETLAADPESAARARAAPSGGVRLLVPAARPERDGERVRLAILRDPWGRDFPVEARPPALARPGEEACASSAAGRAEVTFLPGTVREPVAVLVRDAGWPAHPSPELVALGGLVAVETGPVPLAEDFRIRLEPDRAPDSPGRVAAFVQDGRGFRYIGGRPEEGGAAWVATARTALPIGLFEDRSPPKLGTPRLVEGERVRLVLGVRERGAGLDCDGVEVFCEGRPVPSELDAEREEVVAFPELAGARAASFEIRATDRCGNAARWTGTLRLP